MEEVGDGVNLEARETMLKPRLKHTKYRAQINVQNSPSRLFGE